MKTVRIHITVPGATPSKLQSVKASLTRQGVEVDSVLDAIGIMTGRVAQSSLASLDAGPGATIERDQTVLLAPPDASIQ